MSVLLRCGLHFALKFSREVFIELDFDDHLDWDVFFAKSQPLFDRVHPCGNRKSCPARVGGGDHVPVVVRPHDDRPGGPGPPGGGDRFAEKPWRPLGRGRRAPAQPHAGDYRGRRRGRERGQLRVQSPHPGVAVAGALLGVAMGPPDRVVDIEVGDFRGTGQLPRNLVGESDQQTGDEHVELTDVTKGVSPQLRAQRCRARAAENSRPRPLWRSSRISVMLSAPATIPATRVGTFAGALDPAVPGTVRRSATSSWSPAISARPITGEARR